jgi:phosphodiesterase/alkaline phosphatase D-like protein
MTGFCRFAAMKLPVVLAAALGLSAAAGTVVGATTSPPTATTGQVVSVLPTSASVAGTVDPRGSATKWYFDYGLSTNEGFGSTSAVTVTGATLGDDDVTATLAGFSPATSYHYRLVATNSAGSSYGGTGIFNTSAAPTVVTAAATALTASAASLNGLVNPEALSTRWYFEYGATTAYGLKTPVKTLAASPNISKVTAPLRNLAPQATYHYRLVA